MNKKIPVIAVVLLALGTIFTAQAQVGTLRYRGNFVAGTTYNRDSVQVRNWRTFINSLDTNDIKYDTIIMNGQNASSPRMCTNPFEVRRLAQSLFRRTTYYGSSCAGNIWEVAGSSACWTGNAATDASESGGICADGNGLPTAACKCNQWALNPGIGNANWGAINSTNCPPASQWISLEFRRQVLSNDMRVRATPMNDECSYTQNVEGIFINNGSNNVDSFTYFAVVNSTNYGPFKYRTRLTPGQSVNINVITGLSLTRNTNYTIRIWSTLPNNGTDNNRRNDTATIRLAFKGFPAVPNAIDTSVCGSQRVRLRGVAGAPTDSLVWYSDRLGKTEIGVGRTLLTPRVLASGATYKFWVGAFSSFIRGSMLTTVAAGNGQSGNMFNIRAVGGTVKIDSIYTRCQAANGTVTAFEVYIREGSYLDAGAATTSTMWTQIFSGNVTARGNGNNTVVPVKFDLLAGKNYAMYVQFPNNNLNYTNGSNTYNNGDIEIVTGYGVAANWGGTFNPRTFNGTIFYSKIGCVSALDSAVVTVKKLPIGSSFTQGVPFDLAPMNGGNGSVARPFVVAQGDSLRFNFTAPTGYLDAGHGSTWRINSMQLVSPTGRIVSSGFTYVPPTSSNAGTVVYSPIESDEDSVYTLRARIQDLGPNLCDSTITTRIYVAPLPKINITRGTKICDGEPLTYSNKTTIKRGFVNHLWFFGTGDSSDAPEPVYVYPTYGRYFVSYYAISGLYGYRILKRDTVDVTQIPKVAFKVNNVCDKLTHTFVNQTTVAAGTLSYVWKFGVGNASSTATNPSYTYTTPGKYTVTLTATANGCSQTISKNAYLFPKPVASFNIPSGKLCSNIPVTIDNTSTLSNGNLGAKWNMGDNTIRTEIDPSHIYETGGVFNVKLIANTEFGCLDSTTKQITIQQGPEVKFNVGPTCNQTPTQFTNLTSIPSGINANYRWSFGDGVNSTVVSPVHQYTTLGPKKVKLVSNFDNGCSDSLIQEIKVGVQAIVDFDAKDNCSGKPVQFENKTTYLQGNITYDWNFGDNTTSTQADPTHVYTTGVTKTYVVELKTKVDGACETSRTKQVTIYELPNADFTLEDAWTPGYGFRTVKVSAINSTYPFYRYKFSDGGNINTASGFYQFGFDGFFDVTLCVRNAADCEACKTVSKSIQNSMSIENKVANSVKMYPNPTSSKLNIVANSTINSIEVVNVIGEKVLVKTSIAGSTAVTNFTGFASGVYLVKVNTINGTITQRVTVSK